MSRWLFILVLLVVLSCGQAPQVGVSTNPRSAVAHQNIDPLITENPAGFRLENLKTSLTPRTVAADRYFFEFGFELNSDETFAVSTLKNGEVIGETLLLPETGGYKSEKIELAWGQHYEIELRLCGSASLSSCPRRADEPLIRRFLIPLYSPEGNL